MFDTNIITNFTINNNRIINTKSNMTYKHLDYDKY